MLRRMRPGSVLVDIAIDQGGCAETSHPTTHDHPTYVEEGGDALLRDEHARRLCPHRRTQALTNVTYRYIETLADVGLPEACRMQPALVGGINVMAGKLTHKAVAEAQRTEVGNRRWYEAED